MAKRRITRVTTRRGDNGETSLADGASVAKTDERIHAIGTVDELNSCIGLLLIHLDADGAPAADLHRMQQELFDAGACLATLGAIPAPDHQWLDDAIVKVNEALPPLTEFVIPGGTPGSAFAHLARTVCRRAERHCWSVEDAEAVARYLNRASDLMFVMARALNDGSEPQWRGLEKPET